MDEKTQQRIFEPFFTTKQMGRGTGLGLATVYGIIKGHRGFVTVHSEPGHGTRFDIYLPLSGEETSLQREDARAYVPGSGVVLLVEDEEEVLNATREMLEFLGYRVVAARSGQEALAIYRQRQDEIDLVLMDMIIPGISGGEAVDGLLEVNPSVRIVLASGYSLNGMAGDIMKRGCRAFIQKPYSLNELSRTLSEVSPSDIRGDA
jgi:CheY-like chemotaxis protein